MPTLNIEGQRIKVGDEFMRLSADEQNKTVEEIAASLQIQPSNVAPGGSGAALNATAGVNEGIYGTLGAPVDLVRGAMNLGIRGMNTATGAEIDQIPADSFGGSQWIGRTLGEAHPALNPENTVANTGGERFARGVGQGVGYRKSVV